MPRKTRAKPPGPPDTPASNGGPQDASPDPIKAAIQEASELQRKQAEADLKFREEERQEQRRQEKKRAAWGALEKQVDLSDQRPGEDLGSVDGACAAMATRLRELGELLNKDSSIETIRAWALPKDAPKGWTEVLWKALAIARDLVLRGGDLSIPVATIANHLHQFYEPAVAPGLLNKVRLCFREVRRQTEPQAEKSPAVPQPQPAVQKPAEPLPPGIDLQLLADGRKAAGMSWQEVAERLTRLRRQGEQFTSQHKLAAQLGCSSGTVTKAIWNTPELQPWAKAQPNTPPKTQSIGEAIEDRAEQRRETNPADDASIRDFIEQADPDERAFLNSISGAKSDYQLWYIEQPGKDRERHRKAYRKRIETDHTVRVWFLDLPLDKKLEYLQDPDRHQKILGRKP
jgi:hypothetical protein